MFMFGHFNNIKLLDSISYVSKFLTISRKNRSILIIGKFYICFRRREISVFVLNYLRYFCMENANA
jgi:hypothetical protein